MPRIKNAKAWERLHLTADFVATLMDRIDDQVSAIEETFLPAKEGSG